MMFLQILPRVIFQLDSFHFILIIRLIHTFCYTMKNEWKNSSLNVKLKKTGKSRLFDVCKVCNPYGIVYWFQTRRFRNRTCFLQITDVSCFTHLRTFHPRQTTVQYTSTNNCTSHFPKLFLENPSKQRLYNNLETGAFTSRSDPNKIVGKFLRKNAFHICQEINHGKRTKEEFGNNSRRLRKYFRALRLIKGPPAHKFSTALLHFYVQTFISQTMHFRGARIFFPHPPPFDIRVFPGILSR